METQTTSGTRAKQAAAAQRLSAVAQKAATRAKAAKQQVRAAKSQLKQARKLSKACKKAAKQARKKAQAALLVQERQPASRKAGASRKAKPPTSAGPSKRPLRSAAEVARSPFKRLQNVPPQMRPAASAPATSAPSDPTAPTTS